MMLFAMMLVNIAPAFARPEPQQSSVSHGGMNIGKFQRPSPQSRPTEFP
jgi:hypothetical protein